MPTTSSGKKGANHDGKFFRPFVPDSSSSSEQTNETSTDDDDIPYNRKNGRKQRKTLELTDTDSSTQETPEKSKKDQTSLGSSIQNLSPSGTSEKLAMTSKMTKKRPEEEISDSGSEKASQSRQSSEKKQKKKPLIVESSSDELNFSGFDTPSQIKPKKGENVAMTSVLTKKRPEEEIIGSTSEEEENIIQPRRLRKKRKQTRPIGEYFQHPLGESDLDEIRVSVTNPNDSSENENF